MSTAVIRYRTTPEAAEENQRLVGDVFAELAAAAPPGPRYSSVRLAGGVTREDATLIGSYHGARG